MRVPREVLVPQGEEDDVGEERGELVTVFVEVPVFEEVVEEVIVLDERPDTLDAGDDELVFVLIPVGVLGRVGGIVLVPYDVPVSCRVGKLVRVEVVVLVDVFDAVEVGLNAIPESIRCRISIDSATFLGIAYNNRRRKIIYPI